MVMCFELEEEVQDVNDEEDNRGSAGEREDLSLCFAVVREGFLEGCGKDEGACCDEHEGRHCLGNDVVEGLFGEAHSAN